MKTIQKILFLLLVPFFGFSQNDPGNTSKVGEALRGDKALRADEVRFTDQFSPPDFRSIVFKDSNDFSQRKPIEYAFVRPADVMWSKVTWEIIDLREKMNHPIYYPIDTLQNRRSLIMTLCEAIGRNQIKAYKPSFRGNAYEFKDAIESDSLFSLDKSTYSRSNGGTANQLWSFNEITRILVKEVWYFDRKESQLKNEIIGLCFIRDFEKNLGWYNDRYNYEQRSTYLFWVYYPDIRYYLSKETVLNPYNNTDQYSFDDIFVNRKFKSNFVREANVYNDRLITDYVSGREAQLESERIKQEIFDYEQDLWEN